VTKSPLEVAAVLRPDVLRIGLETESFVDIDPSLQDFCFRVNSLYTTVVKSGN